MSEIAEWFTAIGTVATAIVAVFVAFLPSLRKWYDRPKFKIEFDNEEPFCRHTLTWFGIVKNGGEHPVPAYWIRIKVRNGGRSIARGCEGKLVEIADATTKEPRKDFDPVVLHWVGGSHKPIDINKSEFEYLDVIFIRADHSTVFHINHEERDERGILLSPERKDYFLRIVLYGENVEPLSKSFFLKNHRDYDKSEFHLSET